MLMLPTAKKIASSDQENVIHVLPCDNSIHHDPSKDAFASVLKSCSKHKDLLRGSIAHANIVKTGLFEKSHFLHKTLINMYAKCGALTRAHSLFNELHEQDIRSWNALIAGYVQHAYAEEALECFDQMQQVGVFPDAVTFSCILKACGTLRLADKGQELHTQVLDKGLLEKNLFVANSVVDMYVKCGLLEKAREAFDKLSLRDVVSWNTIIAGHVQHVQAEEALNCFEMMQSCGVSPNSVTFLCILRACGSVGAIEKAEQIQFKIMEEGLLQNNVRLGTALVEIYATCGFFQKAEDVLCEQAVRSADSWNALISGYIQHGHHEDALRCFDQMQLEGFSPNAATFTCILKACGSLGIANKGRLIHAQIAKEASLMKNCAVVNALIDMYAKCGLLENALEVFNKLAKCDAISWNALIAGYAQHGHDEVAMKCFNQMQTGGFSPDAITYVSMLKACGTAGAADDGQKMHAEVVKAGFLDKNTVVANALVDMYAKCGLLAEAQAVFDNLLTRDVISWSALICGYVRHIYSQEALNCFKQMQHEGISPNSVTFLCILRACCNVGAAKKGQELHAEIVKQGLMEENIAVGSAMVDLYASCGMLVEAQAVFNELPVQNVVLWNSLIAGYAFLGKHECVFDTFNRMIDEGIGPDLVTFTILLNTCSQSGRLEKGHGYFESMTSESDIVPTLEHYTCMIDLYGRADHIDEAMSIVRDMHCVADPTLWHTIMGACHKWGNLQLGRSALANIAQFNEDDGAAYVCVSNMFAAYSYK